MTLTFVIQLLLMALPTYLIRFKVGPLPTTLLELLFGIVLVWWLIINRRGLGKKIKTWFGRDWRHNFHWEALAWVLVALVAVGVSHFKLSAFGLWRAYFLEPVILYFIIKDVFKDQPRSKLIIPVAVGAGITAILALYQKLTGTLANPDFCNAPETCRATAWYGYPNAIGLYLEIVVCLLVGLFWQLKNKYERWYVAWVAVLCLCAIWAARSRGALLGLAIGLSVFFLGFNKTKKKGGKKFPPFFLDNFTLQPTCRKRP